jgi:hypothetical protein
MFTVIEVTENLNAIAFDNKKDIRIQICYPKYDMVRKKEAINDFWKYYERLRINSRLNNGEYQ